MALTPCSYLRASDRMSSENSFDLSSASADGTNLRVSGEFRFVRLAEVCRTSGLSRSQIYRLEAAAQFPKRVKLGASASAWIESEVLQWCADRVAASREVAA